MKEQLAPATVKDQRETLENVTSFLGDVWLEQLTPKDAELYFAWRLGTVSPATANKSLRTLKGILNHAVRRNYLAVNPFKAIKPVREAQQDHRVLTEEEIHRLLKACPGPRWRALIFLALSTGMRRGEMVALEWGDLDLPAGIVVVRNKQSHPTKSRKNRTLVLVPAAVELLKKLRDGYQVGPVFRTRHGTLLKNNLDRQFRRIVKRAGIPSCTLHDLRRTFCSHLAMDGVNEAVVQRLAGHASITTTLRHYTSIFPEVLRSAQLRLRYATGGGVIPKSTQIAGEIADGAESEVANHC